MIFDQTNKNKISIFFQNLKNVKEIFDLILLKKKLFFFKEKDFLEERIEMLKDDVLERYQM